MKSKWKLAVSSLLILLPGAVGFFCRERLPKLIPIHWGADGVVDGFGGQLFVMLGVPLFFLAMHWLGLLITMWDQKGRDQSRKVMELVVWICPVLSFFVSGMMYAVSLGIEEGLTRGIWLLLGLMFAALGNYLPKCKQNHTFGIRVKWTLENEENWNMTHRFGGRVWVGGGLLIMLGVFVPGDAAMVLIMGLMFVVAFLPVAYSYYYYRKQLEKGKYEPRTGVLGKGEKRLMKGTGIFTLVLLLVLAGVLFSGEIHYRFEEESFTVEGDFWADLTVEYDAIEELEYREQDQVGSRVGGLGTVRLLAGNFRNEEFGYYTRYSYANTANCVVIKRGGKVLVLNAAEETLTEELYRELLERTGRN